MEMKNYAEAAKRFAFFRDTPQYLQLPGLSDRALLRLGHACAALNQWEQARQAHELLLSQLAGSKWTQEAHYGVGWAREQQGQYDQAVAAYTKAASGTLSETAAMAQLRIGICCMAQNRPQDAAEALLAVPAKYGFDEWNAVALLEAADAYGQLRQTAQQVQVLNRVVQEFPQSSWAKEASKRLAKLPKG